jgi:haloalkane dehalogenase
MHYLDEGPRVAPLVLFMHGQRRWSYAFRDLIARLTRASFRAVAPDYIGFGRSDKLRDPVSRDFKTLSHQSIWSETEF